MDRIVLVDMIQKAKDRVEFRDSLRISDKYINWLERFTQKNGGFDTLMLMHDADKYSEYDKKNIENLETLYQVVDEFAIKNFIAPIETEFGQFYSIKHNDKGFYIGVDGGQGTSFYCTGLTEVEEDALNYSDVVQNIKLPETMRKEQELADLSLIIDRLFYEDKVPVNVIEERVNSVFQKIKKKEQ